MNHIVRFRKIDGQLMFPVPEDVAERLGFADGGEAKVSDDDRRLTVEGLDERKRRQIALAREIIDEHDEALAALAR